MKDTKQKAAAKQFAQFWKDKGYEKGESQPFWLSLLRDVLGIEKPEQFISFEDQVHLDHTSFIDGYIKKTKVMIEQKSLGKKLNQPVKQSDGTTLTPFQQAKRYITELPLSKHPRYIVTCNFAEFYIYDMERPENEPEIVLLKNLEKEYYRLKFLTDTENDNIKKQTEVSLQAGTLVGKLYDALLKQYDNPKSETTLKSLNALCVRIVFCLYAEDAGLFGANTKTMFHDYLKSFLPENFRTALKDLFKILDTPYEQRDKYLNENLLAFPYVNGGLFADETIEIPKFNNEIIDIILNDCSQDFDWSYISPTIFGAVFESTLNPQTRRSGGMHYTSTENIHKVIDPLFLDGLKEEFKTIKQIKTKKLKNDKLAQLQNKTASLKFLDPACGSGNFLTETYISLRLLENEILTEREDLNFMSANFVNPVKVSLKQFYGIEINDFAVSVAKTALWIAESQMTEQTQKIVGHDIDFLPLKDYANIVNANALTTDWQTLKANENVGILFVNEQNNNNEKINYDYIIGNPPFAGARLMDKKQKADLINIFGNNWKNTGNMDFVCAWYKKAFEIIKGTNIKCALVSTNSICQGEQVANLWKKLFADGLQIDFAYRTFRWDSQSNSKAHVHCVIIGFSDSKNKTDKFIIDEKGNKREAKNINGYLIDAENIFIESRTKSLCKVPQMDFGNMPNDAKGMLSNFSQEEKDELCSKYKELKKVFRKLLGSEEYINNKARYCLWFTDEDLSLIRTIPEIKERVAKVKQARLSSTRPATKKLADFPYLFGEIRQPKTNYIIVPRISSENREYVPIGFLDKDTIVNDSVQIIPNATLYEFGILTSNIHNAWMRAVCGRLEMRYRYSKDIVYNNFPWCSATDEQKKEIEQTAQEILNARAKYPESSLAELYDELTMPPELRKAHNQNDKAVIAAYGFTKNLTEPETVTKLFEMYKQLTK